MNLMARLFFFSFFLFLTLRHFSFWINFGIGLSVEGKKTIDVCALGHVSFVFPVFVLGWFVFSFLSQEFINGPLIFPKM